MRRRREGFREARARLIQALETGWFDFEHDQVREGKNLLQSGEVTIEFVIALLKSCSGREHATSPHHFVPGVACHIFTPRAGRVRWYIKCYFVAPHTILISVHMAEH